MIDPWQRASMEAELFDRTVDTLDKALSRIGDLETALKLAVQFGIHSRAYDSDPSLMLSDWVKGGMKGPAPWPSSPFAQEWLREQGFCDCGGHIGRAE